MDAQSSNDESDRQVVEDSKAEKGTGEIRMLEGKA